MPSSKAVWDLFVGGYGPTRTFATACDPKRRQELERDFIAYHDKFSNYLGVAMPRQYLVTIGVRTQLCLAPLCLLTRRPAVCYAASANAGAFTCPIAKRG